ncbi:hypothetical protein Tco_0369326 [Tanacetum coccineum]
MRSLLFTKNQTKPSMKHGSFVKVLLRQCPSTRLHTELTNFDILFTILEFATTLKNALEPAAGGNFLDKMPQEGLAIIESKSKVRYSRSRANDSRVSTDAPLSNSSSPSNNSFDIQQLPLISHSEER